MVGMTGFEPATPSSLTKCATKLRYIPFCFSGVLGRIRTADLPLRRRTLYPAELRGQCINYYTQIKLHFQCEFVILCICNRRIHMKNNLFAAVMISAALLVWYTPASTFHKGLMTFACVFCSLILLRGMNRDDDKK